MSEDVGWQQVRLSSRLWWINPTGAALNLNFEPRLIRTYLPSNHVIVGSRHNLLLHLVFVLIYNSITYELNKKKSPGM